MERLGIRAYQESDLPVIKKFMEDLYDCYAPLDEFARIKRQHGYGEVYTQDLLKKVGDTEGIIYLAADGEKVIGFVACTIIRPSEKSSMASVSPLTDGRVDKLFVEGAYRSQGIGEELMKRAEDFFKEAGCDLARVEVFVPNEGAHRLYQRLGYSDRLVDMVKKL